MISLALIAALFVGASGHPMLRNMKNMNSECLTKCLNNMDNSTSLSVDMDFGNTENYGKQFADMEETCKKMTSARDCMDKCDDLPFNPFDMKAIKLMCSEEKQAEMKKHSACYNDQGNATVERCNEKCGSMDDKTGGLKESILAMNETGRFNFDKLLDSMGDMCTISKCHARCSRDAFNELCRETDPEAGTFMEKFTVEILNTLNEDLSKFGMKRLMKGIIPKECHFIFNPEQLYSDKVTPESDDEEDEDDGKSGNIFSGLFGSSDELRRKQSKLEESQMRLLDKQERNLDKQIEKLNLEIEMLNKKLAL